MKYPPHGVLHIDIYKKVDKPAVPLLWDLVTDPLSYFDWVDEMAERISRDLWPAWVPAASDWGPTRVDIEALTRHDFRLMKPLIRRCTMPATTAPGTPTHEKFFLDEDSRGDGSPGDGLGHYYAGLDPLLHDRHPPSIFADGKLDLVGSTTYLLKTIFQRPRPYQMAMMLGENDFLRFYAATADSPSMISGHCVEACLAGTYLAFDYRRWGPGNGMDWSLAEPALQQWVVDVGDRRVFHQVHYPSDNIGSWFVALTFLDRLAAKGARDMDLYARFLRAAIGKSVVYQAMRLDPPPAPLWPELVALVG